jgi:hypothetical protein
MQRFRTWLDDMLDRAEAHPSVAPLLQLADENVVLGVAGGAVFFLFVGFVGGALNRGVAGAIVGAICAAIAGAAVGGFIGSLVPSRDGEATIAIDLADHPAGFAGGEAISGYVTLSAKRNTRVTAGSVYLTCKAQYVHEGGGDTGGSPDSLVRNVKTYHTQDLPVVPSGLVRRNTPVRYPFRLTLPEDPVPTHHGFGCAVRWTLQARLEGGAQTLDEAHEEVLVRARIPAGAGQKAERVSVASVACEMTMAVQHSTYAEGETIRGRVIVSPMQDFAATELRTVLLRIENHPGGNDTIVWISGWNAETGRYRGESRPGGQGTTYVWLEDEADLALEARYTLGEKKLYDFAFELSPQWRPTLVTDDGSVIWRLVTTLSRANGQDMRVNQGITVHTTAPHIARVMASEPLDAPALARLY